MSKVTVRNRNEGKFYKNGKRKPANWEYRFETASVNGKRQQNSKGGFRTQKEAYDAGAIAYAEYNSTGRTFSPKEISMADYLDYWLEHAIKANLGHGYTYNTYRDYETKIRLHLKPAFGKYRLSALQYSPDVIQEWVDKMKGAGLSRNMVMNSLSCLSSAMEYAVLPLKYILFNPCRSVRIGRMPANKERKEYKEYVCPADEFGRILQRFPQGSNFFLPLQISYHLGTRIGETYGFDLLTDLDLENDTISVSHQLTKENGTWFYRPPKYDSYRTIKIGKTIKKILQEELRSRKKRIIEYGPYYTRTYLLPDNSIAQYRSDTALAIPYKEIWPLSVKENGELMTPESFKYCARVVHYELGNTLFHSHCLRHTHGTILAESGINPKTIMERLGHKDIKTTLQIYTFNTDVMQQNAVDVFETAISQ